jgi:uncharacterized membrane protein required for colicin V production
LERLIVLAYDLAAVLILLQTVAYSSRRGFATGIFRLVGQLAAFFGATYLSRTGAELIYNGFLKTEVTAFLNRSLQGGQVAEIVSQLEAGLEQLPHLSANILSMGIDLDAISQALANSVAGVGTTLEQAVIGPAVRGFVSVVLFLLLFAVFGVLVRVLTSAIHFVFRSPILAPIDRFLGGLLGLLQGSLNLYLVCIGLKLLFYLVGGMKYCNQGIILDTILLSKFYTFDPLSLFVS